MFSRALQRMVLIAWLKYYQYFQFLASAVHPGRRSYTWPRSYVHGHSEAVKESLGIVYGNFLVWAVELASGEKKSRVKKSPACTRCKLDKREISRYSMSAIVQRQGASMMMVMKS